MNALRLQTYMLSDLNHHSHDGSPHKQSARKIGPQFVIKEYIFPRICLPLFRVYEPESGRHYLRQACI